MSLSVKKKRSSNNLLSDIWWLLYYHPYSSFIWVQLFPRILPLNSINGTLKDSWALKGPCPIYPWPSILLFFPTRCTWENLTAWGSNNKGLMFNSSVKRIVVFLELQRKGFSYEHCMNILSIMFSGDYASMNTRHAQYFGTFTYRLSNAF